ncbi:unnamed protein product [Acanthocheilonema viteae]|uniref:Uncharacterized protein n=1 Tax=Acanthocheilonema viteae TaxID=6277 RepID=A0A498S4H1_ACAVI|nr:unnamed protein product [Acanthocheilonema viteae]
MNEGKWVFRRCLREKVTSVRVTKRDTAAVLRKMHGNLRENCFPRPSGGCMCTVKQENGVETVENYDSNEQCKLNITARLVHIVAFALVEILIERSVILSCLRFILIYFPSLQRAVPVDVLCGMMELQTMHNKKQVNEDLKDRYGNYKEDCFPTPSGGCKCIERNADGDKMVRKYDDETECKIPQKIKRIASERPSQNVRDPVRERAQANYRAVINELNEKFKGLKEGCFPRPKGCLCVIGKDQDGRDITERRMKDRDCKCQPGERGHGCPTGGA